MITVYGYMKCSTCRNALAWLDARELAYTFIDITEKPPSAAMLQKILAGGAYELKHLYNTSGLQYRSLNIAEKRASLGEAEQLQLLAGNGMLIKRPIATDGSTFVVGFKEPQWQAAFGG